MSLYGGDNGNWILSTDEKMHPCWVHRFTGQRCYSSFVNGGSPHHYFIQQQQQQQQYAPVVSQHAVPIIIMPQQNGTNLPGFSPSDGMAHGLAGTIPPPLALPGTRWTEHYDTRGKKFWINNLTREITLEDPFF